MREGSYRWWMSLVSVQFHMVQISGDAGHISGDEVEGKLPQTIIDTKICAERCWDVTIIGCTPKGSTATPRSEKGSGEGFSEGFWGRVLRRVLRRGPATGFAVKKGSEKGSPKGFWEGGSEKLPRTPLGEDNPLGVRPKSVCHFAPQMLEECCSLCVSAQH